MEEGAEDGEVGVACKKGSARIEDVLGGSCGKLEQLNADVLKIRDRVSMIPAG